MNQPPAPPNRHSFRPLLFAHADVAPARVEKRKPNPSHVRLRALPSLPGADIAFLDAQDVLDELSEEQLTFSINLACLARGVEATPDEAAIKAARRTLTARIADLTALRDSLADLEDVAVESRVQRLFVEGAPLSDYVRGIYAWVHATVRALENLAGGLTSRTVDWALYRWRIEEGKNFHFDELWEAIHADVEKMRHDDLDDTIIALFTAASVLEESLDQPFRA